MNEQDTENRFEFLKGDKVLWMVILVISIFSIFPVYSASSNLEYIVNNGTTTGHVIKHMFFVVLGLAIMRVVGMVKYEYIGKLSSILLGLMISISNAKKEHLVLLLPNLPLYLHILKLFSYHHLLDRNIVLQKNNHFQLDQLTLFRC